MGTNGHTRSPNSQFPELGGRPLRGANQRSAGTRLGSRNRSPGLKAISKLTEQPKVSGFRIHRAGASNSCSPVRPATANGVTAVSRIRGTGRTRKDTRGHDGARNRVQEDPGGTAAATGRRACCAPAETAGRRWTVGVTRQSCGGCPTHLSRCPINPAGCSLVCAAGRC